MTVNIPNMLEVNLTDEEYDALNILAHENFLDPKNYIKRLLIGYEPKQKKKSSKKYKI